jgi:hypothetical protein
MSRPLTSVSSAQNDATNLFERFDSRSELLPGQLLLITFIKSREELFGLFRKWLASIDVVSEETTVEL